MTLIPHKVKRNGHEYYELVDVKWVNGRTVHRYVGYLGKNLTSKMDVTGKDLMHYVERLLNAHISDSEIKRILEKLELPTEISSITRIVLENDRSLGKTFLRLK